MNTKAAVRKYLEDHNITFETKFVRRTPRADSAKDFWGRTAHIQWLVTINREVFDYSAGIGHLPPWVRKLGKAVQIQAAETGLVEAGAIRTKEVFYRTVITAEGRVREPVCHPEPADVLCCLLTDSDVLNYRSFEDWAPALGYDDDSREGERIYRACLENALKLRSAIGQQAVEDLRKMLEGY